MDSMHEAFDDDVHTIADEQPTPKLACATGFGCRIATSRRWKNCRIRCVKHSCYVSSKNARIRKSLRITGQKIGTVMSRLARARERLKAELTRHSTEARRHDV
jgi:hypothetical protein